MCVPQLMRSHLHKRSRFENTSALCTAKQSAHTCVVVEKGKGRKGGGEAKGGGGDVAALGGEGHTVAIPKTAHC